MQDPISDNFTTTEVAIRFLQLIDDEQVSDVNVTLWPTDDSPAPPERDPRPAGESRVIGSDSDLQDVLDGLGDSDGSDESGYSDGSVPKYEREDGNKRVLHPDGSYHHTLYLVAVYEHETGEWPTNEALTNYFEDQYEDTSTPSPLTSILCNDFEVLDRGKGSTEAGAWCYTYTVNERGKRYLRTFGYPADGPYEVPERLRYEIKPESDDGSE